jgi:hypothetical protein
MKKKRREYVEKLAQLVNAVKWQLIQNEEENAGDALQKKNGKSDDAFSRRQQDVPTKCRDATISIANVNCVGHPMHASDDNQCMHASKLEDSLLSISLATRSAVTSASKKTVRNHHHHHHRKCLCHHPVKWLDLGTAKAIRVT